MIERYEPTIPVPDSNESLLEALHTHRQLWLGQLATGEYSASRQSECNLNMLLDVLNGDIPMQPLTFLDVPGDGPSFF